MNRRTFAASLVATPVFAMPGLRSLAPSARRTFGGRENAFAWFIVDVQLAHSRQAARGLRNAEARDPFDGVQGEFYTQGSTAVDLPDHIPGTVISFDTIVGVAAERGVIHVGALRRDAFVWTIRMRGGPASYVVGVADLIASYDLPSTQRVRLAPSLLNSLLPTPEELSFPVTIRE